MSRRDPAVSLRQMREHAQEVIALVRGRSRGDLDSDRLLGSCSRQAARNHWGSGGRVPLEEQERRPGVPWSSIVRLRNRLIHGDDDIDHDMGVALSSASMFRGNVLGFVVTAHSRPCKVKVKNAPAGFLPEAAVASAHASHARVHGF